MDVERREEGREVNREPTWVAAIPDVHRDLKESEHDS